MLKELGCKEYECDVYFRLYEVKKKRAGKTNDGNRCKNGDYP